MQKFRVQIAGYLRLLVVVDFKLFLIKIVWGNTLSWVVEIETFKNINELQDKVEYYLDKPDLRSEIAKRSMYKAHEFHSFKNRIKTIISYL